MTLGWIGSTGGDARTDRWRPRALRALARGTSATALAFACVAAACGGSTTPSDAGASDAGQPPLPQLDPLAAYEETATEYVPRTLDYACLGTLTQPTGGAAVSTTFQLRDFQNDFAVDQTEVWLFSDNEIADSCDPPNCQSVTTNVMGDATVSLPSDGWVAYRVLPKMGLSRMTTVFAVFQYNFPIPSEAGGAVTGNSVSGSTIDLIPATLGISRTEGLALIAGRVRDCAGNSVENAILRVYDPTGAPLLEGEANDDPHFHYFSGEVERNLPNLAQLHTSPDGLYVLIQIPVTNDGRYRIEAWGNLDGEPTLISCEAARIFPDAVTIVNLNPTRADGPEACR
jgi:hypothetical protein